MDATVNGIHLAYSDQGTGTPVVLLHAFPLNRTMWAPQIAPLSERFRTIAVDLRGHGASGRTYKPHTVDDFATDIVSLLDHLAIPQAVFIGLSMGGYTLMALYRRYPDRVKGLILADTRAQADTAEGRQGRYEMIHTARTQGAGAIADIMIPRVLTPKTIETNPVLVADVRTMIMNNPVDTIVADLQAMADRPDSVPLLPKISCPTRVIVGDLDRGTPPSDAQFMAQRIPGARLSVLPYAGHLSNLEAPEAFNTSVLSFLEGVEGRTA